MKVMLDEGAWTPTRAHESDAGYDLYAKEDVVIPETGKESKNFDEISVGCASIDTGVHMAIPEGYAGLLVSKSGLNVKYGITSTGLIDSGYTGSIVVKLYNHSSKPMVIHKGEKISQIVLIKIDTPTLEFVDKLEDTERGAGGFGSTGK